MKIFKSRLEAPANDLLRNIVPALDNPFCHPRNGNIFAGQRQKPQFNLVTELLPKGYFSQVALTG
ncbi:hypothetical protein B9Z31_15210 [Limnohabitans sp. G3-2]|nr:hypothetical protein B9Z31_15210 [Limnohabitans sp. G3-2]